MTNHTFSTKYGRTYQGHEDGADAQGKPLYRIPDVPIFSECEDTRCHPPHKYNKGFLEEAADNLNDLEAKGHFKPVHFGHHKGMENLEDVGKMANHRVDFLPGYGWTIFCDLVQIPAHIFEKLKDGRISFRSVEIPPPAFNKPIISSLALLSSQDPFHEYPNMIVEEVAAPEGAFFQSVMFCKTGNHDYVSIPYDKEFPTMPKTETKKKFMAPAPAAPAAPAPAAPAPAAPPAPMDPMALIQQVQQQLAALQAKVDAMANGGEETQQPPAASAEPGKMHKGDGMDPRQFAKLAADNLQLKSYLKNQQCKDEVNRLVDEVEKQGTTLDIESLRDTAMTFAKAGPEQWETFANHVLNNNIPPASNLPSARQMDAHDPVLDEYEGDMRVYAKAALEKYHNNSGKMMLGTSKEDFVRGQLRGQFPRYFSKTKTR